MFSIIAILTAGHTALSLVGIVAGLLAIGNLTGHVRQPWVFTFLLLAWATTLTGYLFPVTAITPAFITGIVALAFLGLIYLAQNHYQLAGRWRIVYAASMVISTWLLVFVAIVQGFLKIPALHVYAPNGNEPPFAISQAVALVVFIALGIYTARKFKSAAKAKVVTQPKKLKPAARRR